jgi:hypothetical protein
MHFQLSTATLALFHLTLAHAAVHALNMRSPNAEPTSPIPDVLDAPALNPDHPHFVLTDFEAFLSFPSSPNSYSSPSSKQWSRTSFNVTLMAPKPEDRWRVPCWTHTSGALCTPATWSRCGNATFLNGTAIPNQEDEKMWWKFGDEVKRVELMRNWAYTA